MGGSSLVMFWNESESAVQCDANGNTNSEAWSIRWSQEQSFTTDRMGEETNMCGAGER